ncbi:uncharacterized protein LOC108049439 [Drosophila rhopaloa]|uniref:Uncharacterized protein LOC108049439 n=1 Tax=Drosophila rhopaloa TaxID=1041015 RepID=A0A6P4FAI8_DRORH|nr:uncharacterized protein LOC108049439 [Drosophila rhopaloa]
MCGNCKARIAWIVAGIVGVILLIGVLRYVFYISIFDIILLFPLVIVIGFAYTIKLMSDMECLHLALLAIFPIPICCIFMFVQRIERIIEHWSQLKIFWKIGNILHLTYLIVFPCVWLLFIFHFYCESYIPQTLIIS